MQRTSYARMNCPIARGLERIGDWWTVLILRDAFYGLRRFDELSESLGIAPNMLTKRLRALVEDGLLTKRAYQRRPLRYEYVLTPVGFDFHPVLLALLAWGNEHFAPSRGASVEIARIGSGDIVRPVMVDARSGERIRGSGFRLVPGPGADERMRRRLLERGAAPFSHRQGV